MSQEPAQAEVSAEALARLEQRRREVDANSAAIYRAVRDSAREVEARLLRELESLEHGNASLRSKLRRLQLLLSEARACAAPHVPCRAGCNACCHLQVEISAAEAEMIGAAAGRAPRKLAPGTHTPPKENFGRRQTPCPFLKDQVCSVYDARPLVCRNHVVADVDNLLCGFDNLALATRKDPRAVPVPLFDAAPVFRLYRALNRARPQAWADIRQFFPAEGGGEA